MSDKQGSRIIERFSARTDEGRAVWLVARQHYRIVEQFDGPRECVDTLKTVRTEDGRTVDRISNREFILLDRLRGKIRLRRA
jgi:hypothetical protein